MGRQANENEIENGSSTVISDGYVDHGHQHDDALVNDLSNACQQLTKSKTYRQP